MTASPAVMCSRRLRSRRSLWLLRLSRPQKNFATWAEVENFAVRAIGLAGITAATAMPDEPVTPVCPMLARHQLHQVELDLHRVLVFCQAEPLRETDHVRVQHDAFVFMEGVAEHYIRRLTPNARQG